jgi:hypothetical protein
VPFRRTLRRQLSCALVMALLVPLLAMARQAVPAAGPTDAQVDDAVAKVKADPNLGGTRTLSMLRWRESPDVEPSWWFRWIVNLFRFIGGSSRVLMWVAIVVLALLLVAYLTRVLKAHAAGAGGARFVTPTHVRDLDIRPESLPSDIGAAARRLWDSGDRRAAMALLYRGLLSRLAHVYRAPIRDSTTEGDCLTLAVRYLTEARFQYSAQLVSVWQTAVYGGRDAEQHVVYALCDSFGPVLDEALPASAPVIASGGAV